MLWGKLTKLFPSLLTPLSTMGKHPTLRSTSRRVTMSVLRSSGLHTSSAGLSRIRRDRLEAERLREQQPVVSRTLGPHTLLSSLSSPDQRLFTFSWSSLHHSLFSIALHACHGLPTLHSILRHGSLTIALALGFVNSTALRCPEGK